MSTGSVVDFLVHLIRRPTTLEFRLVRALALIRPQTHPPHSQFDCSVYPAAAVPNLLPRSEVSTVGIARSSVGVNRFRPMLFSPAAF